MVSHPEVVDRSMAPRGPASVTSSRHSHSQFRRHYRHGSGRSHHGGSSHQPLNEFPIFSATGDVEVIIRAANQERHYLLHRLILAQNSGFFEAGTSDEWPRTLPQQEITGVASITNEVGATDASPLVRSDNSLGKEVVNIQQDVDTDIDNENIRRASLSSRRSGSRSIAAPSRETRWRYELDWENREANEMPILVQKTPNGSGTLFAQAQRYQQPPARRNKPLPPQQGFFRSMADLTGMQSALHLPSMAQSEEQELDPTVRDYDNLFRIFYNYSPKLNSVNIATAYSECKSLLSLADMYDALDVTGPRVDHHLLRFSSRLYKQIAKYPPSYLKLGYLARSRVIFSEALIHVVGQWPVALPLVGPSSHSPLPDTVLDLIEDKVEDLEDAIARVEGKLFRLTLTTSRGERVSPFNAYFDWLAVSLFRQWLVDNITPPPASILKRLPSNSTRAHNNISYNYNNTDSAFSSTTTDHSDASGNNISHYSSSTRQPFASGSNGRPSTGNDTIVPFSLGRTYRLIGSPSPQAYLKYDELKRFLKLYPSSDSLYSRDNLKRFERKMDEIKRLARETVKPLTRNFLELDLRGSAAGGGGYVDGSHGSLLPYLTCTRVDEQDFPW